MEERFLLFSAAGRRFAFNLHEIAEVMEPPRTFPLPRAPRHFLGLLNFHGTLTALVDLPLYLGGQAAGGGKVLVLDTRAAQLALLVDGIDAIVPPEAFLAEHPGDDPLIACYLDTEEASYGLLQLDRLVFALEQGLHALD
jgi:purine-binding chemotaxis protein CheW